MNARTASMTLTSAGVRIGIATVPRQRITPTPDAERLQKALLPEHDAQDLVVMRGCAAAVVVLMLMGFAGWLV